MSNPTCKVREPDEMNQGSSVVCSSMGRNRFRTESLVALCVGIRQQVVRRDNPCESYPEGLHLESGEPQSHEVPEERY